MVTYKGYKTGIMYKPEAVYGTAITVDTALQGKVNSFAGNWSNNFFREQGLGEGRNATYTGFGPFDCGGTIEWTIGKFDFLQHCIGAVSGTGTAADMYVLNEGTNVGFTGNDIKSFTMQCFSDETTEMADTYEGCLLNNVTLTATEGDILRATADWVGETVHDNTAGVTYSADTTPLWNFAQGILKWGATPSEVTKITSFAVTITNNLFIYRSLGSRFIQQPETGLRRYDFIITIKADSATHSILQTDLMGQANTPHEAKTSASPTASLEVQLYFEGPTNQKAYIQLDEASLETVGKSVDLGGGIIELTYGGFAKQGLNNTPIKWQTSA